MNQMNHAIRKAGGEIRSKINRAVLFQAARYIDARIFFKRGVADVRIGFVVAQKYVELRLVLLDQIIFERQRLFFVVHHNVIEVGDFTHQRPGLGVLDRFIQEVRPHAIPQRLGFPHVQDVPSRVSKQIDSGLRGQIGNFFADFHRCVTISLELFAAGEPRLPVAVQL